MCCVLGIPPSSSHAKMVRSDTPTHRASSARDNRRTSRICCSLSLGRLVMDLPVR